MIVALIPAFNAVNTIAEVVLKTREVVDLVMVYDDGSTDDTSYVAEKCGAQVFRNSRNRGKGAALRELFEQARKLRPEAAVTLDADMQHDPYDIPKLVEPILRDEADVAVGVRRDVRFVRRVGNIILDFMAGLRKRETQSGFRAYGPAALERIKITTHGYGVDTEILECVKDMRVKEVSVGSRYNQYSHKKNILRHFLEVFNFIFLKRPLLNLGGLGLAGFAVGLWGIFEVVKVWNLYRELALGTFLLSMLFIILGALTFFTGIILHVVKSISVKV